MIDSGSTPTAVGHSQLLVRRPGTLSQILSGIQRAAQTVLGIYLKHTCSGDTRAASALAVLNNDALYKSMHSLTHSALLHEMPSAYHPNIVSPFNADVNKVKYLTVLVNTDRITTAPL